MHRVSVVGGCLNPENGQEFGYPDQQLKQRKALRHKVDHTYFIRDKEKGSQNAKKVFSLIEGPDYKVNGDTLKEKL